MIVHAALAACALLATWVVLGTATVGVGLALRGRIARPAALSGTGVAAAFWMGSAALILFVQLWHLVAPVGSATLVVVGAIAVAGLAEHGRSLRDWLLRLEGRRAWIAAGVVVVIGLWAAHRATAEVANFDTYMYHVPVVDWYRQYAVVPGIANLHGRFAFNNANFLLAALVESGPWQTGSPHLVNGVVLLGFLFHGAVRLAGFAAGTVPSAPAVFDIVLLAPALAIIGQAPMFVGLTPDVPASLAMFAAFSMLFAALHQVPDDPGERGITIVAATAVLASAATIKLSVAAAAVVAWVIGVALLWRLGKSDSPLPRGMLDMAVALAIGIGVAWLIRGVIESGYPFYPSSIAA
ncbi:MAG: LIC_10190 family membrane protein, partial [Longimicrobiales bacterium]